MSLRPEPASACHNRHALTAGSVRCRLLHRLREKTSIEMPLDKDEEFAKARDALILGDTATFEELRSQVSKVIAVLPLLVQL